jgi:hypothetical protein
MSIENRSKLKKLLQSWLPGMVATYAWLRPNGISPQLVERYVRSGWLSQLASGAYVRLGDSPTWAGALYALQYQLNLPVHVGGRSAIELRGYGHYLRQKQEIHLYGRAKLKLPTWVERLSFEDAVLFYTSSNLFDDMALGVSEVSTEGFTLRCSSLERAMLEMLAFVPERYGYAEAAHLMEGLKSLRPKVVQGLLKNCRSIKAKRLFLHLATACGHSWLNHVDVSSIDLGSGVRKLLGGGRFDKKHLLYVPDQPLNEGLS